MSRKYIRDSAQKPIGIVDEGTTVDKLMSGDGRTLLATYNHSTNKTYDAKGRLVGNGDLLQTQIRN
jgi:hypothetical protein